MINPSQYADLILEPSFKAIDMYSLDAMYLLLGTAMVESKLTHIKQLPLGPALGFMQIEPDTYMAVVQYLNRKRDIKEKILRYCEYSSLPVSCDAIIHNMAYNAIIARVKYWMIPEPLPSYKEIESMGEYWKKYYNTHIGKGKAEDFLYIYDSLAGCINHGNV